MKLLQRCSSTTRCHQIGIARLFRVFSYSTEIASASASASSDSLYGRISPFGNPEVPISPILDQWVQEGGRIDRAQLRRTIRLLRKFRRFSQALQVSEWMSSSCAGISPSDIAVQLDLISKVQGLEQAEQYFKNIPNNMVGFHVYGALLNCYARAKCLEKAEATLQKMRELGFARTPLSYNVMLNFYSKTREHVKLDSLVREMEDRGITCDKFTFSIQMSSYAMIPDIERMEKILMKMEADPKVSMDWNAYAQAANGYLKAGLIEKALATLKKLEVLIGSGTRLALEVLLTQYGRMGKKDEVYRIWNLCKKNEKIYNTSYLCMMSSLAKLGDLEGMEKIFEEWEATKTCFDIRIPNLLISAYCQNSLLDKAELIVKKIIESGREPNANSWLHLATAYCKHDLTENVVDTVKRSIFSRGPPNLDLFAG